MSPTDTHAHQIEAWRSLTSGQRRKLIKDRKQFPRFGWPSIYPAEKDPLAPRPVAALRETIASAVQAPVAPGFAL